MEKDDKLDLLTHILQNDISDSVLVFSRTKHGADKIARKLQKHKISAEAIHGNKSQNQRQNALTNFKSGKSRVLVATDIAARGIDIDELKYVVNFEPVSYTHLDVYKRQRLCSLNRLVFPIVSQEILMFTELHPKMFRIHPRLKTFGTKPKI